MANEGKRNIALNTHLTGHDGSRRVNELVVNSASAATEAGFPDRSLRILDLELNLYLAGEYGSGTWMLPQPNRSHEYELTWACSSFSREFVPNVLGRTSAAPSRKWDCMDVNGVCTVHSASCDTLINHPVNGGTKRAWAHEAKGRLACAADVICRQFRELQRNAN